MAMHASLSGLALKKPRLCGSRSGMHYNYPPSKHAYTNRNSEINLICYRQNISKKQMSTSI
jgi:hypothetical protein